MTDRYNALLVTLANDTREDDAQPIIDAIRQLRGVIDVTGNVVDCDHHIAKRQAQHDLRMRLWSVLNE